MNYSFKIALTATLLLTAATSVLMSQKTILIQPGFTYMDARAMVAPPAPGDTIKVISGRSQTLKFKYLEGTLAKPIVIINSGGQVSISTTAWGALAFENCRFIKVSGSGDKNVRYGFKLQGIECGLSFSEYSSDCEAEFVEILGSGSTFFGIYAKKDFGGTPPVPYPQFNNLVIHDNYIHDVTEGLYIGETKSPGMEFRHVKIYNNIVENTGRESAQLANCVEDIEVHHNLFRNSGLTNEASQNNCLQIGANTVGKYYNNILQNCPGYGAIIFGMGNIEVISNYIEHNPGSFIDDRYRTLPNTSITLKNNYFRSSMGAEVIKNMNQYNSLIFQDNKYDTSIPFLTSSGGTPPVLVNTGNTLTTLPPMEFEATNGVFRVNPAGPPVYALIGPPSPVPPASSRIVLNQQMLTDLVTGGSTYSPKYLVDEQAVNPDLNRHPVSLPWKPAKTLKNSPYHILIDLGSDYFIDRISLHDLGTTGNVVVSYETSGNWVVLFTDPPTKAKTWTNQSVKIVARYIRLSMNTSLDAKINELALFGYRFSPQQSPDTNSGLRVKSGPPDTGKDKKIMNLQEAEYAVYPNPVNDLLTITPFESGMRAELLNSSGKMVRSAKTGTVLTSGLPAGIYFLKVTDCFGMVLVQTTIIKSQ